jgi:hypothetical protein
VVVDDVEVPRGDAVVVSDVEVPGSDIVLADDVEVPASESEEAHGGAVAGVVVAVLETAGDSVPTVMASLPCKMHSRFVFALQGLGARFDG